MLPLKKTAQITYSYSDHVTADSLYIAGQYERALKLYQGCEKHYKSTEEQEDYIVIQLSIASCYLKLGNNAKANELTNQAEELLKNQADNPSKKILSRLYQNKGDLAKANYQPPGVISNYRKALEIGAIEDESPALSLAKMQLDIGKSYRVLGQYDSALHFARLSRSGMEKLANMDPAILADCIQENAIINDGLGNYQNAEKFFEEALQIRKKAFGNDNIQVAASYRSLGAFYLNREAIQQIDRLFQTRARNL